ncbi:MAG: HAD family hydrolase [Christensenellales bacterium]
MLHAAPRGPVQAVLFDFDGTISTLRCGWEKVMKPLMVESISGGTRPDAELERMVDEYIHESTGIQTILQMRWLSETAARYGRNPSAPKDPWAYKAEYNRRLMETVETRLDALQSGRVPKEQFLIAGSERCLKALVARGVRLYVASGTDHPDVVREAAALGVDRYFTEIAGAPVASESCSKEKVLAQLIEKEALGGDALAVVGDGKVEIRLGREAGARTIGLASDEEALRGVNPVKRERLVKAGADAICGDFTDLASILDFLGL